MSSLGDNLSRVRERMARAAEQSGRSAEDITLVAVTKRQSVQTVQEALNLGLLDLGENYVQEARDKQSSLPDLETASVRWHLLGHLQRNKAIMAVHTFEMVQSVDSVKIAQALGQSATGQGKMLAVLVQVHLGQEPTKTGFAPEEVSDAVAEIGSVPGIDVQGLMGIAPAGEDARLYFRDLRALFDRLPPAQRQTLSMGMTGDFETAIEEGTTMIRIGTALFGPRNT